MAHVEKFRINFSCLSFEISLNQIILLPFFVVFFSLGFPGFEGNILVHSKKISLICKIIYATA